MPDDINPNAPPSILPEGWTVRPPDQVVPPLMLSSDPRVMVDFLKSAATDVPRVAADAATFGTAPAAMAAAQQQWTGGNYKEALEDQLARNEQAKTRLGPFLSMGAEFAGGGATAAGLGRLGVTSVGRYAGQPIKTLLAGTGEGAIYGGLQGAGHTRNPEDLGANTATGAGMGSILGFGAPLAGGIGGAASRYFAGQRSGVPDFLLKAAAADEAGLRAIPSMPDAMLPDAGPSMRTAAQGVFSGGVGPGHSALETNLRTRDLGVNQRIATTLDANAGRAIVPSAEQAGTTGRMQAMAPEYQQVMLNSRATDTEPIAHWLEGHIGMERGKGQAALREVRRMLDIADAPGVLDPHPEVLQKVRTAVRSMMDDPRTSDPNTQRLLGDAYNRITREMHDKIPGIRELDARYAELAAQHAALGPRSQGSRIFDTAKETVIRPQEFANYMSEAAVPKGVNVGPSAEPFRAQQAVRAELDRIVGTNINDLNKLKSVLATPEDYNAQKLASAFGPERARNIMALMEREPRYRETYQKIVQGSQTDPRAAAREAFDAGAGPIPKEASLFGTTMRVGQKAYDTLRLGASEDARDRIAAQLATQDPQRMAAIADSWLRMGRERGAKANALRDLITSGIIGGGGATTVPPFVLK